MNSEPLISVVVAVYDGANTLQQCVDSFASQTYKRKELIVIDGGSTDGSLEIIHRNSQTICHWVSEPDDGIYNAWNKALTLLEGDWVCFLGADDYFWSHLALEQMAEYLSGAYPPYRVVYGQVALVNSKGDVLHQIAKPWSFVKKQFKQVMTGLPHQGVMHHKSLFEMYGPFDDSFKIAGDYELLLRELDCHDAMFVSDVILTAMCCGGVSSEHSNSLIVLNEFRKAHKKILGTGSGWRWWLAYLKVRCRMLLWFILGESLARKFLDLSRVCVGAPKHWTRR